MAAGAKHYTGAAGREYHEKKRAIPPEAFAWVARLRAEKIQPHVGRDDVVFEYGAGFGWNLAALRCGEKIGSDLSEFLAEDLSRHAIRFVGQTHLLADRCADVVICHHTLEHVLSPVAVLEELRRLLKAKGKLLLYVPFERERRYRHFRAEEPNHHLYSWNVQTLGNLVEECGWKVETAGVGSFGYDRFAAKQAVRWKLGEAGFRTLRRLVHWIQPGLEVRLVATIRP